MDVDLTGDGDGDESSRRTSSRVATTWSLAPQHGRRCGRWTWQVVAVADQVNAHVNEGEPSESIS